MPTPSYMIMNDIKPLRAQYQEEGNYAAALATDLVDDHVDGLKSQYYNAEEYYEKVVERLNALLNLDSLGEEEKGGIRRILEEIVLPHQTRFLEQKNG